MRYASYWRGCKPNFGLVSESGIIDLSRRYPQYASLRHCLELDVLDELAAACGECEPDHGFDDVRFDIPIPFPEKIICVGINYPARNEEYKDGSATRAFPSLFVRFPGSLVGHRCPIVRPQESDMLDYEGELALVIGQSGRRIKEKDALNHVAGLSLCNDGTIRDWARHAKFNVTQGKNFDGSGSMGPWMVRYRRPEQLTDIRLTTRVNGEVRQQDRTSRMLFSPARLIAYISTFATLKPGDVIVTGTPVGSGIRLTPPKFLQPGDVVEISASGIGRLENTVVS